MAHYHKDMSQSQKIKYNDYHRKLYLIKQLEKGRVPHPKKAAPWLLALYERYGVSSRVVIPMSWMSKEQVKKARNRERYLRSCKWH